jgi:hypothetical protein
MNTNETEKQFQDAADKAKKLAAEAQNTFMGLTPTLQYCVVGIAALVTSFFLGITAGLIVAAAGGAGVYFYNKGKGK